jgi:hypothetical protein
VCKYALNRESGKVSTEVSYDQKESGIGKVVLAEGGLDRYEEEWDR